MVVYVLDTAGLKFKVFHLTGPCLFLKRRFNNRKNNCSSFLPEWHSLPPTVSLKQSLMLARGTVLPLLSPRIWDMGRKEGWAFSAHHPAQGEKMLHLTLKCSDAKCFAKDSPNRWTGKQRKPSLVCQNTCKTKLNYYFFWLNNTKMKHLVHHFKGWLLTTSNKYISMATEWRNYGTANLYLVPGWGILQLRFGRSKMSFFYPTGVLFIHHPFYYLNRL